MERRALWPSLLHRRQGELSAGEGTLSPVGTWMGHGPILPKSLETPTSVKNRSFGGRELPAGDIWCLIPLFHALPGPFLNHVEGHCGRCIRPCRSRNEGSGEARIGSHGLCSER